MTVLADLGALRRAIELSGPDGVSIPPLSSGVGGVQVTTGPDGVVDLVTVEVRDSVSIAEIEGVLGRSKQQPARGPGRPTMVTFTDTIPDDGTVGATVMAEVDGDRVTKLWLRRDDVPPLAD